MTSLAFKLSESTAFFNFTRMVLQMIDEADMIVSARLLPKGQDVERKYPTQQVCRIDACGQAVVQALIDRAAFPDGYKIELIARSGRYEADCTALVEFERREHQQCSLDHFLACLQAWRAANPARAPEVLDVGGRARSGYLLADHLPDCRTSVLDIRADAGVDIVADVHDMSATIGRDRFDFIVCVSVFEHLVMPWKAALEMNKVLRPGGVALIQTHQTVGLHDRPWDYFRFSDDAWTGLFNAATGFEIVKTMMSNFVRITPMRYFCVERDGEKSGGFYESSVIVRKIGTTTLEWPVDRAAIVDSTYPA